MPRYLHFSPSSSVRVFNSFSLSGRPAYETTQNDGTVGQTKTVLRVLEGSRALGRACRDELGDADVRYCRRRAISYHRMQFEDRAFVLQELTVDQNGAKRKPFLTGVCFVRPNLWYCAVCTELRKPRMRHGLVSYISRDSGGGRLT
jgi:hypothetical protein